MPTIFNASTSSGAIIVPDTSGDIALQNNGTTAVTVTGGNVGIGTSSPATKLHVSEGNIRVGSTNAGASLGTYEFSFTGSAALATIEAVRVTNNSTSNLLFSTAASGTLSEKMRIDSSGNLLVGKTTVSTSTGAGLVLYGQSTISGYGRIDYCKTNSGTNTANEFSYNGTPVGTITYSNTATAYNTSSDYRLKENIAPMQNALKVVQQLKPVTYKWKVDGSSGQGFIAHELQAVVPDCVTGEKDAVETVDDLDADGKKIGTKEVPRYQGIDTSFLVATLTKAIQELNAKVEAQALQITALQGVK